ncbi:MAG TPA: 50S ribosomal protein L25 [Trueperaceae bacterium]|nr:50S ribosomal protein L25 [Trueperaceae bacterium]
MKLAAEKRGKGGLSELRRNGRLPAVIYNREINMSVSIETRAFDKAFRTAGNSSLIDLDIAGDVHSVIVKQVQMDKRRREPMHVDFYAVSANEAIQVPVPVEYVGNPVGVRDGGQLHVQRREVLISVLPRDIPAHIELDVSALEIGESLHVADIVDKLPATAEVLDDLDLALVAVVPPRVAEEEEEGLEAAEPQVVGEVDEDEEGAGEDSAEE